MTNKVSGPPKRASKANRETESLASTLEQFEVRFMQLEWTCESTYLGKHYNHNSYSESQELDGFISYLKILDFEEVNDGLLFKNPLFQKEFRNFEASVHVKYVKKNSRNYEILFIYARKKDFIAPPSKISSQFALSLEEEMKEVMVQLKRVMSGGESNEILKLRFVDLYTRESFY